MGSIVGGGHREGLQKGNREKKPYKNGLFIYKKEKKHVLFKTSLCTL
jgi:hypothetical protein